MAKFPQLDWVAINGRDTPFTKPQHYKEGSTSETDLTGHDNPLPTTDKSVRAELESIKATQDKILKRLDEPLPTQLAGSKVEDGLPVSLVGANVVLANEADHTIPVGSYSSLYFGNTIDFKEIKASIVLGEKQKFRVQNTERGKLTSHSFGYPIVIDQRNEGTSRAVGSASVSASRTDVRLVNHDDLDLKVLEILIVGVK